MATKEKKTTKMELALSMGRSISELRIHLRQYMQARIKQQGINLTFEMIEVLSCLWKKDGINQQEIALSTLKDKSSVTYIIANLVRRKLIKRVEDANDRRNNLVYMTEAGRATHKQLRPLFEEVYSLATEDLTIAELETLMQLLTRMMTSLTSPNLAG